LVNLHHKYFAKIFNVVSTLITIVAVTGFV